MYAKATGFFATKMDGNFPNVSFDESTLGTTKSPISWNDPVQTLSSLLLGSNLTQMSCQHLWKSAHTNTIWMQHFAEMLMLHVWNTHTQKKCFPLPRVTCQHNSEEWPDDMNSSSFPVDGECHGVCDCIFLKLHSNLWVTRWQLFLSQCEF